MDTSRTAGKNPIPGKSSSHWGMDTSLDKKQYFKQIRNQEAGTPRNHSEETAASLRNAKAVC
jgi:hypothetical protein